MANNRINDDREIRSFTVELRADNEDPESLPEITGQAAVFNQLSEVLWDFRETIEPGFFENVLNDDVRALWNHNDDKPLGRTRSNTLFLSETETGLNVRILPPETTWGVDAITSMRRGDVNQMSFAFSVKPGGDEWKRDDDGNIIRVLKRGGCERLYDVSPVTYPAYPQTSAQVRSRAQEFIEEGQAAPDEGAEDAQAQARSEIRKRKLQLTKLELF